MKNQKITRWCSKILILGGMLCILISLSIYTLIYLNDFKIYKEFNDNPNVFEDILIQTSSEDLDDVLENDILEDDIETSELQEELIINSSLAETSSLYFNDPTIEREFIVETITINGENYIGTIKIDDINVNLPIHEIWTDAKLDTAPCVYKGSLAGGDLIIGAHNTRAHFAELNTLEAGAIATISDASGQEHTFILKESAVISETEVRILENIRNYQLTLFTCDNDSRKRLVQRWYAI